MSTSSGGIDETMRMRILVVDDEVGVTTALKRGLTADGFDVDVAHDGVEGLWLAETNPYRLIILDIMLPKMNGYRVCSTLRANGNVTPILMLTAKEGEYDEAEGLDTGADDYLTKPFSYVVLLARLRALLRRSANELRNEELVAGDLRFDSRSRKCWRGQTEIDLSPKAAAVLEFLMNHAGAVVTKDEILTNVWDRNFEGDPNIIEVYVSRIRSAIDTPFDRSALATVRGVGYRFDPRGG